MKLCIWHKYADKLNVLYDLHKIENCINWILNLIGIRYIIFIIVKWLGIDLLSSATLNQPTENYLPILNFSKNQNDENV